MFRSALIYHQKALVWCRGASTVTTIKSNTMTKQVTLEGGACKDSSEVVTLSVGILRKHGVIAVPTDTVYGVAGLAQSAQAVRRLYSIKKRDASKPVAICVGDISDVYRWAKVTISRPLLECLLPGAVTLIFERTPELNIHLNPDTQLVGVRIPDSTFIRALCQRLVDSPLALTSANFSSHCSTLSIDEFEDLWPMVDLVVDGGVLCQGEETIQRLGSTVVDLSEEGTFTIVRKGCCLRSTKDKLITFGLREAR